MLEKCVSRQREISFLFELYCSDPPHIGRYPACLADIGAYLAINRRNFSEGFDPLRCPAGGAYQYQFDPDGYTVSCSGYHAGLQYGYPKYSARDGSNTGPR